MTSDTLIVGNQPALARRRSPSASLPDARPRSLLSVVCAASAGVHAGIVPEHLTEAGPRLAAVFAGTTAVLLLATALTSRPRYDNWAPASAAALLTAVAIAYLLSRITGLPGLIGDPESFDPVGVITSAGELLGAVAGIVLHTNRKEPA